MVGNFKNGGREWRPKATPEEMCVHDFLIKELGHAVPYGIYDLAANKGWVSVGIDNDAAAFAVATLSPGQAAGHHGRWWQVEQFARASLEI